MRETENMNNGELIKNTIEEFSRIQSYMMACDKEAQVYKMLRSRYLELKTILSALSVNIVELDYIKE